MPATVLKSIADKAGVGMDKAEKAWSDAKAAAHKQYPDLSEADDKFWAIVTTITKKMLGVKESFVTLCDVELFKVEKLHEVKFIQDAIKHEGALRKHFGVGPDETIPRDMAQKELDALSAKAEKGKLSADELQLLRQLNLFLKVLS